MVLKIDKFLLQKSVFLSICEKNATRSLVREFRNKTAGQLVLKMY